MKTIWDRIHVWLAEHAPEVLASLRPPATNEQVRAAEEAMGVHFPADVKACYRIHDGQGAVEGEYEPPGFLYGWEWHSLEDVLGEWRTHKELVDDGTFTSDIRSNPRGPIRDDWWHPKWIPLTANGGGDHHCLDLAPKRGGRVGQIIIWWHDDSHRVVLARSLTQWLADFADELEAGEYTTSPDYHGLVHVSDL
jgi:cell wall assembly regulator SMI1